MLELFVVVNVIFSTNATCGTPSLTPYEGQPNITSTPCPHLDDEIQ